MSDCSQSIWDSRTVNGVPVHPDAICRNHTQLSIASFRELYAVKA